MKRKLLSACLLTGMAFTQHALAADGTITFTGQIYANTCTINGGSNNFTVNLPAAVSSSQLDIAGKTAGRTGFQIALTNCPAATNVHTFYEPGATTNGAGRLINTDGTGAANVEIQLLNDDATAIKAGFADSQQNSKSVALSGNAATLSYFAEYYATGAATAGAVTSSVSYTIVYN
jgi:major type 1 subunit fimbrin (pilin)